MIECEIKLNKKGKNNIWVIFGKEIYLGNYLEEVFVHLFPIPQAAHLRPGGEVTKLKAPKI